MIFDAKPDRPPGAAGHARAAAIDCEAGGPFDDLLAAISHEIRTPLTAVIGFCDLMGAEIFGPVGDPRYAAYLRHIADGGAALLKSAEDTLALSALISGSQRAQTRAIFRVDVVASQIVEGVRPLAAARSIAIEVVVPFGLSSVADPNTYRQALTNLVLAAIDRSDCGGHVAITASLAAGSIQLSVAALHTRPRPTGGGPSLALRIARTLVELDGSRLSIHEEAGVGDRGAWRAVVWLEPSAQDDLFQARA